MKAVIMAGGKGTRLSSLTGTEIPKPLYKILGTPILERAVLSLKNQGITEFVFCIGYLAPKICEYFGNGEKLGVSIEYVIENEPLGSGGALFYLKDKLAGDFLVLSGDIIFDVDVSRMVAFHREKNAVATLFVHPNAHPFDSDLVIFGKDFRARGFDKKDNQRDYYYDNAVNAGFMIINSSALSFFGQTPQKVGLEHGFINGLISRGDGVYAYISPEYVKDVGTPERIGKAEADLKSGTVAKKNLKNKQKCVFLDRDGTLNVYKHFINNADDLELLPTVAEALKKLNGSEYLAVVITNQPVVARGECSFEELDRMHKKLQTLLGKEGAYLDGIYFCPHHPHKGFEGEVPELKIECACRKPKTGMIDECVSRFNIDLNESFMVGDTDVDIQTGKNAGLKTVRVKSPAPYAFAQGGLSADFEANNLLSAINYILGD